MANADIAFRPGAAVVRGKYIYDRTPQDQDLIDRFADAFLQVRERTTIASILAKKITELRFDSEEAQILKSRSDVMFTTGCAPGNGQRDKLGMPLLQFYDFVLTIDSMIAKMRALNLQVMNLGSVGHLQETVRKLKNVILPDTWIPWAFHERMEKPDWIPNVYHMGLGAAPHGAVEAAAGQANRDLIPSKSQFAENLRLGSDTVFHTPIVQSAEVPRTISKPKSLYDKACDEAFLLHNEVINGLVALSQGLFKIFETPAMCFTTLPRQADEIVSRTARIPEGSWINTFVATLNPNDHVDENPMNPIDGPYSVPLPPKTETNPWYATADPLSGPPAHNTWPDHWNPDADMINSFGYTNGTIPWRHQLLQPKSVSLDPNFHGMDFYPRNWMGRLGYSLFAIPETSDAQTNEFAWPSVGMARHLQAVHRMPKTGGAIGRYVFTIQKVGPHYGDHAIRAWPQPPAVGDWPGRSNTWIRLPGPGQHIARDSRLLFAQAAGDFVQGAHNNQTPQLKDVIEFRPEEAIQVNWKMVVETMEALTSHPIWACPRLARAYNESKLNATLLNMYGMLQRNFSTTLKSVDVTSQSIESNALALPSIIGDSFNILPLGTCPEGSLPQYFDYDGYVYDQENATFMQNGVRWLKSNIDPKKCKCSPLVRAPDALAVTAATQRRLAADRGASVYPATASVISMPNVALASADVLAQIRAAGGVLSAQRGGAPVVGAQGGVGGAIMRALMASKGRFSMGDDEDDEDDGQEQEVGIGRTIEVGGGQARARRQGRKDSSRYKVVLKPTAKGWTQRFYVLRSPGRNSEGKE